MSASLFDDTLNVCLNDVHLPAGLLAKLRAIPLGEDADLDAALADVPVPAEMLAVLPVQRLEPIGEPDSDGAGESAGRPSRPSVPADGLNGRRRWRCPLAQAAAALLVFAASLGYALSAVAFVRGRFEEHLPAGLPLYTVVSAVEREDAWLDERSTVLEPPASGLLAPPLEDAMLAAAFADVPFSWRGGAIRAASKATAVARVAAEIPFWQTPLDERLYDLASVDRAAVRLANAPALDRRLWRQTGVLPWLNPLENREIDVPLAQSDASYRLARQRIQSGRLPAPAEVRCEEFVAGVDYGLQNEGAAKPLVLAAAPSPFAPSVHDHGHAAATSRWLLMVATFAPDEGTRDFAIDRRLNFEFSPERVAAYRMVGYCPPENEAPSDGNGLEESGRSRVGHAAVVLCEIELRRGYERDDELVRVGLGVTYGAPRGGRVEHTSATLRAGMFSPDFDSAPVIWRQAAVVALAAERLAGSLYAGPGLGEIAGLARQIEPAVYDRPGWREFIVMLVRAQTLRGSLISTF